MAHRAHRKKTTKLRAAAPARTPRAVLVKEVCPECGYAAKHLVKTAACPMCKPCPRCGRKLMQCECLEGE